MNPPQSKLPDAVDNDPGPFAETLAGNSPPVPSDPTATLTIDRFTLVRPIGQGGMGDVFLATHPITGLPVALKRLKPSLVPDRQHVQRFLTEARHMYHLNHPHILRIMEVWDPPAGPYYVMPYMERGSLANQIRPGQPSDYVFTLRIARDIANALAYAHSKGIIHRDLKPLNVLMDADGRAFLSDFGLVRVFNTHDPDLDVRNSAAEGTAPYMSPAVARGEAEDTRCDIYSFGAMLYELLTGHAPYDGTSAYDVRIQVLAGPPVPILKRNPHAPPGLVKIAEGAMARELRDRYSSMGDVIADLERVDGQRVPVGPHGRERGKLPAKWLAVASFLVLAVAGWFIVARLRASHHTGTPSVTQTPPKEIVALPSTTHPAAQSDSTARFAPPPPTVLTHTDSEGHRVVDLMPLIDPDRDALIGVWRKGANGLSSDGDGRNRLRIRYEPPAEYDYKVEFIRTGGNDEVIQFFSGNGMPAVWDMGARGNSVHAFRGNSSGTKGSSTSHAGSLTNGKRCVSVIEIRSGSVSVVLDGQQIIRYQTDFNDMRAHESGLIGGTELGLGSRLSPTLFHSVEVVERSGRGTAWAHPKDDSELVRILKADQPTRRVDFSRDGQFAVSLSAGFPRGSEMYMVWDVQEGRVVSAGGHGIRTFAFSPDGKHVMFADAASVELATGIKTEQDPHVGSNRWTDVCAKNSLLAGGGADQSIRIIDVSEFPKTQERSQLRWQDSFNCQTFVFAPAGDRLAAASSVASSIRMWNVVTGDELWRRRTDGGVPKILFDGQGRRLLEVTGSQNTLVLNATTGELLARCVHRTKVGDAVFSADGNFLFTCDSDPAGGLHFWDLSAGKEVERFELTGAVKVNAIAVSKDGHRLLAACDDWTVRLFDTDIGKQLHRYIGHDKAVNCVAFSPDEKTFAFGSDDRTVRIWKLPEGAGTPPALPK